MTPRHHRKELLTKILFATDGSDGARTALDLLLDLPLRTDDELVVLSVPVYSFPATTPELDGLLLQAISIQRELAERCASDAAREALAKGVRATALVREGPIAATIAETAAEARADLIVVGSRGLGGVAGALLGSTARALARHAPVPVLVVRDRRVAPRRILAAVDGSPDALVALQLLRTLPLPPDAEIALLHVVADRPETSFASQPPEVARRVREAVSRGDERVADAVLAQAAVVLGRRATHAVVGRGEVVGQILARSAAAGTDLIVLGSRGQTLGGGFLQGSVADRVLAEARCAVLVARASSEPHATRQTTLVEVQKRRE